MKKISLIFTVLISLFVYSDLYACESDYDCDKGMRCMKHEGLERREGQDRDREDRHGGQDRQDWQETPQGTCVGGLPGNSNAGQPFYTPTDELGNSNRPSRTGCSSGNCGGCLHSSDSNDVCPNR